MKKIIISLCILHCTFCIVHFSTAQDMQWMNPLPQGNDLNCVRFVNENTGYAVGNAGTILKTSDGGLSWALQHSGTTADLNSLFFTDENTGFVIGSKRYHYGYILKTTDGGATWTIQPFEHANWETIYFTSSDTGYAGGKRWGGHGADIQMTTDGGISWTSQVSGIGPGNISSIFFANKLTGFAVGSTFLKTGDGGISWTNLNNASGESVFFTDSTTGYIAGGDGNILKTIDGGASWTILNADTTYDLHSIFFTSANTGFAVGGRWNMASGIILKTQDAGATWTSLALDDVPELFSVYFTGTNAGLAVGRFGTIIRSDNGGTSWTCISERTISESLNSTFFLNAGAGYAVGDGGTIIKTTDGGRSWTTQSSGTSLSLKSVCFASEYNGYAVGDSGCFLKTTNGGTTWTFQSLGDSIALVVVDFPTHDTGYAIGNNRVFSTIDGGVHWTSKILLEPLDVSWLSSMYFVNKDTGYVVGDRWSMHGITGYIFKTINGGANWTCSGGREIYQLFLVFFWDANTGYVSGYRAEDWISTSRTPFIKKTTDGGSTWTETYIDFTPADIYFTSADTGYIMVEDDSTFHNLVQMTTDGGMTWSDNLFSSQKSLNSMYFPDPGTGYIVGEQGTILKVTTSGGNPFGINDPSAFGQSLKIFPNPAGGIVDFRWSMVDFRRISLKVYNVQGQEIATVRDGPWPGNQMVRWDASGLPVGIYLVRLQAGDVVATEKMVVMR